MSLNTILKRKDSVDESQVKKFKPNSRPKNNDFTRDEFKELTIDLPSGDNETKKSYWSSCADGYHIAGEYPKRDDELCRLDIGKNVYVVVNTFNGERLIHIRTYETPKDREMYPTKKGVALDLRKWLSRNFCRSVDEAIEQYRQNREVDLVKDLGSNFRVTLRNGYPIVHIRRWFLPLDKEEFLPTKKGVALNFQQWEKLKDAMKYVETLIGSEIDDVDMCDVLHRNQQEALMCPDCNPEQELY